MLLTAMKTKRLKLRFLRCQRKCRRLYLPFCSSALPKAANLSSILNAGLCPISLTGRVPPSTHFGQRQRLSELNWLVCWLGKLGVQ